METRHRAQIVIADDHTLVAEAFKALIEPEFEVVAIANDGRELLKVAIEKRPDVVLLDIAMPMLNGLDAGEQLKQMMRSVKIIYLSYHAEPNICAEAFRRGASGYIVKHSAADELVRAIRVVLRGGSYITPRIARETAMFLLRTSNGLSPESKLTSRQRQVLQLFAEGKAMKEVATILNVKPGTVAFHKYKTMEVLGVRTTADLLRYAIENHLVS